MRVLSLRKPTKGGARQYVTPARLITSEILVFESVKSFRNSGNEPDENAQKKWLAK
jgi:hypothetical protein